MSVQLTLRHTLVKLLRTLNKIVGKFTITSKFFFSKVKKLQTSLNVIVRELEELLKNYLLGCSLCIQFRFPPFNSVFALLSWASFSLWWDSCLHGVIACWANFFIFKMTSQPFLSEKDSYCLFPVGGVLIQ